MKIKSELQKYLSENLKPFLIILAVSLTAFIISPEFILPIFLIVTLFYFYHKKSRSEQTKSQISLIERKRIDNDLNLILIGYNNKHFLIFSNKNYAFSIKEEENDIRTI